MIKKNTKELKIEIIDILDEIKTPEYKIKSVRLVDGVYEEKGQKHLVVDIRFKVSDLMLERKYSHDRKYLEELKKEGAYIEQFFHEIKNVNKDLIYFNDIEFKEILINWLNLNKF